MPCLSFPSETQKPIQFFSVSLQTPTSLPISLPVSLKTQIQYSLKSYLLSLSQPAIFDIDFKLQQTHLSYKSFESKETIKPNPPPQTYSQLSINQEREKKNSSQPSVNNKAQFKLPNLSRNLPKPSETEAMRDRGKAVESSTNVLLSDAFPSDPPCRKHPSSSSVGICAYCLKDRLIKLVCSDCGEQRLSSCSCSDISSNRNSCSVEVGSVGRISFLIENEKAEGAESGNHSKHSSHSRKCVEKVEAATAVLLKRNCSSSVYEKRKAFWHVGWLFKKKKEMDSSALGRNSSASEEKGEMLPSDRLGLSGSRPVVGLDESEGGFSGKNRSFPVPGCVNREGFSEIDGGFGGSKGSDLDCEKAAGFIDMMAGLSSEPKRGFSGLKSGGFVGQETGFLGEKDAGFIDLEVDFLSKSKGGLSGLKGASYVDSENELGNVKVGGLSSLGRFGSLRCGLLEHGSDLKVGGFSSFQGNGLGGLRCCSLDHEPGSLGQFRSADSLSNGSSCRITVNDCEIRGGKRSLKVWKWIFKNSRGRSGRK